MSLRGRDNVPIADAFATVVRRIAALGDPSMRKAVWCELLAAGPADVAVERIDGVVAAARRGADPRLQATVEALALALGEGGLGYERRAALYQVAVDTGRDTVARLLFVTSRATDPPPPAPERALQQGGRALTLGERKSLARDGRRDLLQRLARDPDAAVIRILLENPRLIEADVVAIAARRPGRPDVLRAVYSSIWVRRHTVKRALVFNPATPPDLVLRLLPTLGAADLREAAECATLVLAVREQARRLIGPKRTPPGTR